VILDNYSIHKSKKVALYVKRFPMIHLFYLPPYSPEYNPVDRVWGWIKPKVYGFSAVGGMEEVVSRFRKLVWHYKEGNHVKSIHLKLEAYQSIL